MKERKWDLTKLDFHFICYLIFGVTTIRSWLFLFKIWYWGEYLNPKGMGIEEGEGK